MADEAIAKQVGKLLYFDPNNVTIKKDGDNLPAIFNGLELMKNPEDYSIAVDLEVINKSRNNVTSNDEKMNFGMMETKGTTNFLQGKNIGDTNVLSTFFTDITYSGDEATNVNEAMCINSIDIEFTSWYVASVIIKFTDIRGASLYSPSEYLATENTNKKVPDGSLFSGFFTMPYPIFNLKVKGFYGNTVTYPLHLTEFKSEFDAEKGNVDITCHFIGYTYALLNDVQMTYLIAAPNTPEGNTYWESQIQNERFKTLEGNNLPKIPVLLKRIKDGEHARTDMNANNTTVISVRELGEKEKLVSKIKTFIDNYIDALNKNYTVVNISNKYNITITTKETSPTKLTKEMENDPLVFPYIRNLTAMVSEFNLTYPKDTMFSKKPNPVDFFTLSLNASPATSATLNLTDIINKIDIFVKNANYEKKILGEQVSSTVNNRLVEIYQMVPSIYNFTKILLAHMETLIHIIGECANEIIKSDRDGLSLGANENSDFVGNKFSPFPWFTINNKDEWIGNNYPNISEVTLVNSLIKAKTEISNELLKLETQTPTSNIAETGTTLTVGDVWFPINAFDNSISAIGGKTEKPYSNISKTTATVDEIKALISTRISTIVGLSADATYNKDANNSYNSFILGESKNITEQLGQSFNTIENTKLAIKDIGASIPSSDMLKRNKYKLLTKYTVGTKNYYEYDLLNTGGLLPLNDDPISTHQKHISGGAITDDLMNFYKPSNVTGNTNYNKCNPTNTIIINGKADCDKIYRDWYLRVKNLYNPEVDSDLSIMLKNYRLEKSDMLNSVVNVNYEAQPLLNRITYFKQEVNEAGTNKVQIDNLNENCGFLPESLIFNSESNPNFLNLFKGYLSKNTYQDVQNSTIEELNIENFLNEESLDKSKLSYPMIGGVNAIKINKKTIKYDMFSLFGSELYYYQNDSSNEIGADKAKAFLFLQTLPIKITSLDTLLTDPDGLDRSFMIKMPKAEALLIGSMIWRYYKHGWIYQPKGYIFPTEINSYFKSKDIFVTSKDINYVWDICEILPKIIQHTDMSYQFMMLFYKWTNSLEADGWLTIREAFEFKWKTLDETLNPDAFIDIAKKFQEGAFYLEDVLSSGFTENYRYSDSISKNSIGLINKDGGPGTKAVIELLFNECIVAYSGDGILKNKVRNVGTSLDYDIVSKIKDGIYNNLERQKENLKTKGVPMADGTTIDTNSLAVVDNENINLQVYRYLKNLYDKWVSGYKFNSTDSEYKWIDTSKTKVNGYETFDITNFKFIDRAYNNIGDRFIIDYSDVLENMIGLSEQKTLYSTITGILSKSQFLFIPMPNYQSWSTAADFAEIFQPIPYLKSNMNDETSTSIFICMYTGTPSKRLNIASTAYQYQDDALNLNINNNNQVSEDFNSTPEKDALNTNNMNVPAFAVSYGKQNQSYFKNIQLNQNDPVTTEASINVLRQLNDRTNKNSAVTTTNQDMFNLYSDYAYTCNVNMLGCAQIQPMMYFQLTNVPMWNGAYLIYKVNHSIKPGYMSTNFTGMRMSKNYPILVTPGIVTQDKLSSDVASITPESRAVTTLSFDSKIGKYFTLKEYTTTDFNTENAHEKEVYEYILSRLQNNLAPTVDFIYDTWIVSESGKQHGPFKINSGYRSNTPTSQHYQGLAVDIQLKKPTEAGNQALFDHIKGKMKTGLKMDQLIKERFTSSTNGGWCHVSPVKFKDGMVYVRGESFYMNQTTQETSNKEIIENAKGSAKLAVYGSAYNAWLDYWKKAENGIKEGFNVKTDENGVKTKVNDNKWYAHISVEGGPRTIAYGIKLNPDSMLTDTMKLINITDLSNGVVGISDDEAIAEISARAIAALKYIQPVVDAYGYGSFDKITERNKYGLVDIYLNTGSIKNWPKFIQAAIVNNTELMIVESHRTNVGNRNELFAAYLRG